jgi:hypothetical protein
MERVIAIAVLAALGCGSKDKPPPPPPEHGLVIVDPGLAPRSQLRYQLAKGATTAMEVDAEIEMGSGTQKIIWPALTMGSEVVAEEILPDGTMKVRYSMRSATAVDRPNQQVTADQMNPPLQDLVGMSITGTLTPGGVLGALTVDTGGKQLPPALAGQVGVLTRALDRMVMPLPPEPVGVGALWKFEQPLDQTGMKLLATTTIKATALTPTSVTIVLTSEITGPDQETSAAGPKVKLSGIKGTMRGTGTIDLTRLVLTGELVADLQMNMTADGETERTSMTTTLRMKQSPAAQGAQNAP